MFLSFCVSHTKLRFYKKLGTEIRLMDETLKDGTWPWKNTQASSWLSVLLFSPHNTVTYLPGSETNFKIGKAMSRTGPNNSKLHS